MYRGRLYVALIFVNFKAQLHYSQNPTKQHEMSVIL